MAIQGAIAVGPALHYEAQGSIAWAQAKLTYYVQHFAATVIDVTVTLILTLNLYEP